VAPIRLYPIKRYAHLKPGFAHGPTPFDTDHPSSIEFFKDRGIIFTDDPRRCHLFVASHAFPAWWNGWKRKAQLILRYQYRRSILIWSDEPSNIDPPMFRWSLLQPMAHVMNIYSGDVLLSNLAFAGWSMQKDLPFKRLEDCPEPGRARIVGLVGYVPDPQPRIVQGENRDLNWLRMALLKYGAVHGLIDIYGANWPAGMSKENSRAGNWWARKREILSQYEICVALENTTFDYYCTEKIWQALSGGCLPIYYGQGNRIYDTFPRHSFIDAAEYPSVEAIYS
jgi:hypothetical protein